MFQRFFLFLFSIILLFSSCKQEAATKNIISSGNQYAQNFKIIEKESYQILEVSNVLDNSNEIYRYVLYDNEPPSDVENAIFIKKPIKSVVCLSTTHAAMLTALAAEEVITGATNINLLYNSSLISKVKNNQIIELGNETSLNYEILVDLQPDVVFTYGLNDVNQIEKLKTLGLKPVVVAEFRENAPLARAEWIKFFGAFSDKEELANNTFEKISSEYNFLKEKSRNESQKPTVFTGSPFQGVWYVPGGQSYLAKYIEDAGGNYIWKEKVGRLSISMSFEAVYEKAYQAEKWLDVGFVFSKNDLLKTDERFGQFNAFKKNEMYNYTARVNDNGGFDIYESAVVYPNIVLKDLVKIFHPSLLPEYSFFYYEKMK